MDYNQKYRGDVYATHGMGPACQVLDIHRGDRMKTLVSMDTKAVNGPAYIKKRTGKEVKDFQNGDQTTTMIRTENERTMLIQHNVMTPRPYSRMYQVVGTDGFASKYPVSEYCLRPSQVSSTEIPDHENLNAHGAVPAGVKKALMAKYKSPILDKELEETAKKVGGHGAWIILWIIAWCIVCVMVYRWIWMFTIWRNGAVWPNLPAFLLKIILLRWKCLTSLVAGGIK